MPPVDLDRIFLRFTPEERRTSGLSWDDVPSSGVSAFRWPQLLEQRLVVLLAEASSGKTTEFRTQAEALHRDGKAGFFLDLATLAEGGLAACLDVAQRRRYDAWRRSTEDAWFFLDAVDELRLTRRKLDTALNRLAAELGEDLSRARVFISSRITDWHGEDDLALIARCLPIPANRPPQSGDGSIAKQGDDDVADAPAAPVTGASTQTASPVLVTLKPLDRERMGRLAAAHGLNDVGAFLNAISRRGLEPLSERPGDLLMLASYWTRHRSLGPLEKMMEELVKEKLSERNDRHRLEQALDPEQALAAVERIAAAMTLGQTLTIASPSADPDPTRADGALDPHETLSDVSQTERDALLRLGVFAPETLGRIRFHHRTTQDYLTARWLRRLIEAGGREAVRDLVFDSPHGIDVVRPAFRAAVAWLALWDDKTCREVTRRDPRLLLDAGDPASLPSPARPAVLRAFVEMLAEGETNDAWIEDRMVALFAQPDLAADIRSLWASYRTHDVHCFLLRLVLWGPVPACADLARDALRAPGSDAELRLYALRAAAAFGDTEVLQSVAEHLRRNPQCVPSRHVATYLDVLVPTYLPVAEVAYVLRPVATASDFELALVADALGESAKRWTRADRLALLVGLVSLVRDMMPPGHDKAPYDSPPPALASHLGTFVGLVLADQGDTEPNQALLDALALFEAHGDNADVVRLRDLLEARPILKRALFWHDVAAARRRWPNRPIAHPMEAWPGDNQLWHLTWNDQEWLRRDVTNRPLDEDRALALTALVVMARGIGVLATELDGLRRLADDAGLQEHLERLLVPPQPSPEQLAHEAEMARRAEERRRRKEGIERAWKAFADRLKADPDALAVTEPVREEVLNNLANLYDRLRSTASQDRLKPHWNDLKPEFGVDVAQRYAAALKQLWRITEPVPPTRNGDTLTREWVSVLSLHGLDLEAADDPNWLTALTDAELRRALNHVLVADEQLPPWFASAACARPQVSVPLLDSRLKHEWTRETSFSPLLSALAHDTGQLLDLMRTPALWLFIKPARDLDRLDAAIRILRHLQPDRKQREVLAKRTEEHLRAARDCQDDQMALGCLRLLFTLAPAAAAAVVETWLGTTPKESRHQAAVMLFSALEDEIGPVAADDRAASVQALATLVRLAFRYVRPEDDNRHDGPHGLDQRDHAEMARGRLFKVLTETPGAEAHAALADLLNDDDVIRGRPWLRRAIRDHALVDAARPPLRPADVIRVEREHLAPIQNGDDLYRHALRELRGIDRDFRDADFSSRDVVATAKDEMSVQTWLAERLTERSRGRWQVVREPEVADKKEPDICIHAIRGPWQMAIEVKLCVTNGKWSRPELEAALRDQLVGLYLRIDQRRHGCLVVINQGRTWRTPDGTAIDFQTVMGELNALADRISAKQPVTVSVVGIEAGQVAKTVH